MKKAFTLIELLVVIAIIIILASLVFVGIKDSQKQARDAKRAAEISQIRRALMGFQAINGMLPPNIPNCGPWECGSEYVAHPDPMGFLAILINPGTSKSMPVEKYNILDEVFGVGEPGAYRYQWFPEGMDVCNDGHAYGVVYATCESGKCDTGEVDISCSDWPFPEGFVNDNNSIIYFIKD